MIIFKTLTIRNFISYGNSVTSFSLDRAGTTTLIAGENLDDTDDGVSANGVGKTVFLNALTYALYDKAASNISKDKLINNINNKNMEVTLSFDKDGTSYKITRARKMKAGAAGNYVIFEKDGKDITPDSVGNTNDLLAKVIGIPYEVFVRIVAFSAALEPFLGLSMRAQSDIIEELFDLKTLSARATLLKEQIKSSEMSMAVAVARNAQLEKEHARHNEQLNRNKQRLVRWEAEKENSIVSIESDLERIKGVDISEQQDYHNNITSKLAELKDIAHAQSTMIDEIDDLKRIVSSKISENDQLRDAKCPYCAQPYDNAEHKLAENRKSIEATLAEIDKLTAETIKQDESMAVLENIISDIKSRITVSDISELRRIEKEQDQMIARLAELRKNENPYFEILTELEGVCLDAINMTDVNDTAALIEHQKFLLKLLTKKDSFIRKALLDKSIPFLNERLSHYTHELGLSHVVMFTHEMSAKITQFGRELDFGNLSTGQRARVNLALSFAFRDVLQSSHDFINMCVLDEVLDVGLDSKGVTKAAAMIKQKARDENLSMYVITHRDEINSVFDDKITIQMSGGFSRIKTD